MIINGCSCANVARLQWLNECGEVKVTKQVLIAFAIGQYSNEVMCDANHLLLGHP
jgi:hypothetical protein